MIPIASEAKVAPTNAPWFATTHWTVVLGAAEGSSTAARLALEQLCQTYWYPLYAYARRRGRSAHDAEDLVQGFFLRLIEKEVLRRLARDGGRFRSFLLTCFNHFLSDEHDRAGACMRLTGCSVEAIKRA